MKVNLLLECVCCVLPIKIQIHDLRSQTQFLALGSGMPWRQLYWGSWRERTKFLCRSSAAPLSYQRIVLKSFQMMLYLVVLALSEKGKHSHDKGAFEKKGVKRGDKWWNSMTVEICPSIVGQNVHPPVCSVQNCNHLGWNFPCWIYVSCCIDFFKSFS